MQYSGDIQTEKQVKPIPWKTMGTDWDLLPQLLFWLLPELTPHVGFDKNAESRKVFRFEKKSILAQN